MFFYFQPLPDALHGFHAVFVLAEGRQPDISSPLGPKPTPGVPTTLASYSICSKNRQELVPSGVFFWLRLLCTLERVQEREFWQLLEEVLGRSYGRALARDQVLDRLNGLTAVEALEMGEEPRVVWNVLCVPDEHS